LTSTPAIFTGTVTCLLLRKRLLSSVISFDHRIVCRFTVFSKS
jgi:hypothetical protein